MPARAIEGRPGATKRQIRPRDRQDAGAGEGGKKLTVVGCLTTVCKVKIEKCVHGEFKYK